MVGSGPYMVTEFERGRILRMERNPEWPGAEPEFDEIQFIQYGTEDAVERALQLGEIDMVIEVQPATFERLGDEPNIETVKAPSPAFTELAFNLCSEKNCPDAQFNPAVQDRSRAPGDRLRDRPRADQRDLRPGHLVRRQRDPAVRSTRRSTR